MMHQIEIRLAKLNEIPRVKHVTQLAYEVPYKETGIATKPHEPKEIEEMIKRNDLFIFVAIQDGEIIGSIRCEIQKDAKLYFSMLAVLKEYRNQGVGSKLVETVEEFAKAKKCGYVVLDCLKEKKLDEYYEKRGYKINDTKEHNGHHEVYMSKFL